MQFALYGTMTMDTNVFMIGFSSNKKKDLGNHVMKDKPFTLQAIRGCHISNVAMVIFCFQR
jgi:hypothetical protein